MVGTPADRGPAAARFAVGALALGLSLLAAGCGAGQPGATIASVLPEHPSPLVRQGESLYESDGCSSCHTLDGSPGTGPTFRGLVGSTVRLEGGRTLTADRAWLVQAITEPGAQTVTGYPPGLMAAGTAAFDLKAHASEVSALIAFIDAVSGR
ncbi:MAG TPA: c-type cytochrome [Solirubrobacteraceae bacterium]|jgi:cytochrome c oxidase subunit 2|nr:c-type cytochrome [Solirubrobacteraceae bacterium]